MFALLAGVAVLAYLVDQVTKFVAVATLTGAASKEVIGSFLRLTLIRNPGAAFSLGTGSTWVLTLIAVLVLVVVIRTSRRIGSLGWAWALGLLLGGALGNLTDRLVREPGFGRGYVVDFIDYNNWFIGNVADIAIVSAAVLIGLLAISGVGVDGRRERRQADAPDPAPDQLPDVVPHTPPDIVPPDRASPDTAPGAAAPTATPRPCASPDDV